MCHPFYRYIPCSHCGALCCWPRWIRKEHLEYESLCHPCHEWIDATFTSDMAVMQAIILIGIEQGKQRPLQIGGVL